MTSRVASQSHQAMLNVTWAIHVSFSIWWQAGRWLFSFFSFLRQQTCHISILTGGPSWWQSDQRKIHTGFRTLAALLPAVWTSLDRDTNAQHGNHFLSFIHAENGYRPLHGATLEWETERGERQTTLHPPPSFFFLQYFLISFRESFDSFPLSFLFCSYVHYKILHCLRQVYGLHFFNMPWKPPGQFSCNLLTLSV